MNQNGRLVSGRCSSTFVECLSRTRPTALQQQPRKTRSIPSSQSSMVLPADHAPAEEEVPECAEIHERKLTSLYRATYFSRRGCRKAKSLKCLKSRSVVGVDRPSRGALSGMYVSKSVSVVEGRRAGTTGGATE